MIYAAVQVDTPNFALGRIIHAEFFDKPPNYDFQALGQIILAGNINGGDTQRFNTLTELNDWLVDGDIISMTELDNRLDVQNGS